MNPRTVIMSVILTFYDRALANGDPVANKNQIAFYKLPLTATWLINGARALISNRSLVQTTHEAVLQEHYVRRDYCQQRLREFRHKAAGAPVKHYRMEPANET